MLYTLGTFSPKIQVLFRLLNCYRRNALFLGSFWTAWPRRWGHCDLSNVDGSLPVFRCSSPQLYETHLVIFAKLCRWVVTVACRGASLVCWYWRRAFRHWFLFTSAAKTMLVTVPFQAAQFEREANLWKPRRKLNCPLISRATVQFRMQRQVFQWESKYLTLSVNRNLKCGNA